MVRGYLMIAAEYFGYSIPIILFGGLCALTCKPGVKRRGFFVGASICAILMLVGQARSDEQQSCLQIGQSIRLCGIPAGWKQVQVHPQAEAEFLRADGFSAQVIRDQAGQNQGVTLKDAANTIVQYVGTARGAEFQNFVLLMRGTNQNINDSEIIVYKVAILGIPYIFANTLYVGRNESIQLITWRIAKELTVEDRAAHLDFLQGLVIMPSF